MWKSRISFIQVEVQSTASTETEGASKKGLKYQTIKFCKPQSFKQVQNWVYNIISTWVGTMQSCLVKPKY